jgi:hypothetical protein
MHAGVSQRRDIDSIRPDFQRAILRTNTTGAVDRDPLCETLGWGSLPESDAPFLPYPQHVRNASNGAHQHLANSHLFGLTIRSPHFTSSRPFYEILTVPSNCNQVAARQFGYSRITHTPCRLAYSVRPRTGSTPCPRRFGWQPRLTSSPYISSPAPSLAALRYQASDAFACALLRVESHLCGRFIIPAVLLISATNMQSTAATLVMSKSFAGRKR